MNESNGHLLDNVTWFWTEGSRSCIPRYI